MGRKKVFPEGGAKGKAILFKSKRFIFCTVAVLDLTGISSVNCVRPTIAMHKTNNARV